MTYKKLFIPKNVDKNEDVESILKKIKKEERMKNFLDEFDDFQSDQDNFILDQDFRLSLIEMGVDDE